MKAIADGYQPTEKTITIKDKNVYISLELEAIQYTLTVKTQPTDAFISLPGTDFNYKPAMLLPPGDYPLRVEANGYIPEETIVSISNENKTLSIELKQKKLNPQQAVATVNGINITRGVLDQVIEMVKLSNPKEKLDEKAILDDLIITELARQEALKSGLADREDIKSKIKNFTDKLSLNAWTSEKSSSFNIEDKTLQREKMLEYMEKIRNKADINITFNESTFSNISPETSVATVNGQNITKATLDAVAMLVSQSSQEKPDKKIILDDLITTELARQEANKSGLYEREDIKNKVKDFSDKLILNTWTQEKASSFNTDDKKLQQNKMLEYMNELRSKADIKIML